MTKFSKTQVGMEVKNDKDSSQGEFGTKGRWDMITFIVL